MSMMSDGTIVSIRSDKCRWEGEHLIPCDALRGSKCVISNKGAAYNSYDLCEYRVFLFCPYCGSDIRKPEPEVIIKKSGQTWVARSDGSDWLCINPDYYGKEVCEEDLAKQVMLGGSNWIKFNKDTEITDDIAKNRPYVVYKENIKILYAVFIAKSWWPHCIIHGDIKRDAETVDFSEIRLACVDDLP